MISLQLPVGSVVHCRKASYDVYIGRATPRYGLAASRWANPFTIGRDGDRQQVIEKYLKWLLEQPELLRDVGGLSGKVLGCWCAPQLCHGDMLSLVANGRWFNKSVWKALEWLYRRLLLTPQLEERCERKVFG